jgi:hypothetical protein
MALPVVIFDDYGALVLQTRIKKRYLTLRFLNLRVRVHKYSNWWLEFPHLKIKKLN